MSPLLRWAGGLVSWILLTPARYIGAVDVDPISPNGPVPRILLPNGQPERCLESYFQLGRLMRVAWDVFEMVSLDAISSCSVQCINTWDITLRGKFYHSFFQHLGHITPGCFITLQCSNRRNASNRGNAATAEMQQLPELQQLPKCSDCRNASIGKNAATEGTPATAVIQQLQERQQWQKCSKRRNASNRGNVATAGTPATAEMQQLLECQQPP
jgi:hypothetical protein